MESSSSSSPEPAAGNLEYVGFWKRLIASLIDTFILTVVLVPLMIGIYGLSHFDPQRALAGKDGAGVWDWLINLSIVVITILFWKFRGATPGKMAISARIVDAKTGGPPSTGKLIVRFFAYIVSTLPFCLGFLWIAFDRKKRGWHDLIAGTVVVHED